MPIPIGQVVTAGTTKLTVIGVLAEKGTVGDVDYDSRLYMPITVVFQKFTPSFFARIMGDSVRMIYVEVDGWREHGRRHRADRAPACQAA